MFWALLTGVKGIVSHEWQMSRWSEGITLYYSLNNSSEPIAVQWRGGNLLWPDPIWTDRGLVPQFRPCTAQKENLAYHVTVHQRPEIWLCIQANETSSQSTPQHLWPMTKADSRVHYERVEVPQCQDLPCEKTAEPCYQKRRACYFSSISDLSSARRT